MKENILSLAVILLLFFLIFEKCNNKDEKKNEPKVETKQEVTYRIKDSVIVRQLTINESVAPSKKTIDTFYLPSKNYDSLLVQYNNLVNDFHTKNIYKDTIKIDTIGYVSITDSVFKNQLLKRAFEYNIKYPTIRETITITNPQQRNMWIGLGVEGSKINLVNQLSINLLYKDRKNRMFGGKVGLDIAGQTYYGAQTYWNLW